MTREADAGVSLMGQRLNREKGRLPEDFFHDLDNLQTTAATSSSNDDRITERAPSPTAVATSQVKVEEQLKLLKAVRELEDKLARAKADLHSSMKQKTSHSPTLQTVQDGPAPVVLSKDDYLGLVDLYYYSYQNRFNPESPDASPTPTFIEDYSFKLSEDFSSPEAYANFYHNDEKYESPLKQVEQMLKSRQLREISLMQAFVDLLLDDKSSNRALFEVYQQFPQPGVAYLPRGVIRLFLQRMSTPWTKSEKSMLRYLSLIDDMQRAGLPITDAEWSSAIYLAGRSFAQVTEAEVTSSFAIWRQMEKEAGVMAHHVTFNILFDIAVRAGKFALAETVLREMHDRGLRLNRLGRVSLIYYHGLRGDGDGVRKTYRDFVEAGEIVDTLVLNCVIAALLNAQEPAAAEQVYERMKNMQTRLRKGRGDHGQEALYMRYPPPGSRHLNQEMASNQLGRTLLYASRLKDILPDHHAQLQSVMPLTPDHITFRSMISYHANVTGDLDRLTVLMNEMTELFGLPFQSINFQLLFKGFALHGATRDPDATWSVKRLDLVWDACRIAIKEAQRSNRRAGAKDDPQPTLPTVKEVDALSAEEERLRAEEERLRAESRQSSPPNEHLKLKKLSPWHEFVLDLAAFPRERRKPIERVHALLFDDEVTRNQQLKFKTPFFGHPPPEQPHHQQESYYPVGESKLDHEEGEYVLPPPTASVGPGRSRFGASAPSSGTVGHEGHVTDVHLGATPGLEMHLARSKTGPEAAQGQDEQEREGEGRDDQDGDDDSNHWRPGEHEIRATRPLICWLLRAYTRCTGSRAKVEEVWNSARKLWRPLDEMEKDSVIRVLRRCLRDCDRFGPPL